MRRRTQPECACPTLSRTTARFAESKKTAIPCSSFTTVPTKVRLGASATGAGGWIIGTGGGGGAIIGAGGRRDDEKTGRSRVTARAANGIPHSGLPRCSRSARSGAGELSREAGLVGVRETATLGPPRAASSSSGRSPRVFACAAMPPSTAAPTSSPMGKTPGLVTNSLVRTAEKQIGNGLRSISVGYAYHNFAGSGIRHALKLGFLSLESGACCFYTETYPEFFRNCSRVLVA